MAISSDKYRILGVYEAGFIYAVTTTATERPVKFINKVDFSNDINEIDFEGDQQRERVYVFNGLTVSVEADYFDLAALANTFNKTKATGITGVAERTYFGENAETLGVAAGFYCKAQALESVAAVTCNIRIVIPYGTVTAIEAPSFGYNAKAQLKFKVTAQKTTVDIAAQALTGVPSDGCHWYIDQLS